MKRVLLFATVTFLLSSCAVKYPYKQYSTVVDFTEFAQDGFFITESNSVSFDYEPVGSVRAYVESGYEILKQDESLKDKEKDGIYTYQDLGKMKLGEYKQAYPRDAIAEMVNKAKELGANGVINFNIVYIAGTYDKYGNVLTTSSCVVSGMAIKY